MNTEQRQQFNDIEKATYLQMIDACRSLRQKDVINDIQSIKDELQQIKNNLIKNKQP